MVEGVYNGSSLFVSYQRAIQIPEDMRIRGNIPDSKLHIREVKILREGCSRTGIIPTVRTCNRRHACLEIHEGHIFNQEPFSIGHNQTHSVLSVLVSIT